MTVQFYQMLQALNQSVFGNEYNKTECEFNSVCTLALEQGVFPLVYPVLCDNNSYSDVKWEMLFLKTIAINEKKMHCLKNVLENMGKAGVEVCVLKGASVASVYHMPECRASGDVDLYIEEKDEKVAMKVMSDMDMDVFPRKNGSHHFEARDKSGGLFEVHISLFSEMLDDIVFQNRFSVSEPFVKTEMKDGTVINSLGIQDNLNFLTAHLIKHFVKEGCGIRQITDLLAYINYYRDKIDFEKYFALLGEIKFDKFVKNILGIGVKYFRLQFDSFETELSDKILNDVENGGNFGFSDEERRGFHEKFLRIRSGETSEKFEEKLTKRKRMNMLKNAFMPSRTFLIKKGYNYLNKTIVLYPVAYFGRIFSLIKAFVSRKRNISSLKYKEKTNSAIKERLGLMKEMEII